MVTHDEVYALHRRVIDAELRVRGNVDQLAVIVWSDATRSVCRRAEVNLSATRAGRVPVAIYVRGKRAVIEHEVGGA